MTFENYLKNKKISHGDKFDPSDLDPRFALYWENKKRIQVQFSDGEIKSGTVGITTGWKPIFLLMLRRNSHGSIYTLGKDDTILKEVKR